MKHTEMLKKIILELDFFVLCTCEALLFEAVAYITNEALLSLLGTVSRVARRDPWPKSPLG